MKKILIFGIIIVLILISGCDNDTTGKAYAGEDIYCGAVGTRSEGWYGSNGLIKYDNCNGCYAICEYMGTKSQGWYNSCTGQSSTSRLIKYDSSCDNIPEIDIDPFTYLCGDPDGPYPELYRNNVTYVEGQDISKFCQLSPNLKFPSFLGYDVFFEDDFDTELTKGTFTCIVKDSRGRLFTNKPVTLPLSIKIKAGQFSSKIDLKKESGTIKCSLEMDPTEKSISDTHFKIKESYANLMTDSLGVIDLRVGPDPSNDEEPLILAYAEGDLGYGTLSGKVVDENGNPVEGATVCFRKSKGAAEGVQEPCIDGRETVTDSSGNFIMNIPASPQRNLVWATKEGYVSNAFGDFPIWKDEVKEITILLQSDTVKDAVMLSQFLDVADLLIIDVDAADDVIKMPSYIAVLDQNLYPENVKPYLEPGIKSNYNNPVVQKAIQDILKDIPVNQRKNQTLVAKKAFEWQAKQILGRQTDDPSAHNFLGRWSKGFFDWLYSADEAILRKNGICIDQQMATATLLKGLGIPARTVPELPGHPVTQWWVQLPDGTGYWANNEGSAGLQNYRAYHEIHDGKLISPGFPAVPEHILNVISPNGTRIYTHGDISGLESDTWNQEISLYDTNMLPVKDNWEAISNTLLETYSTFKSDGIILNQEGSGIQWEGGITCSDKNTSECIWIEADDVRMSLANLGKQRKFSFIFPLTNNPRHKICYLNNGVLVCKRLEELTLADESAIAEGYYSNHPEWVESSEIQTLYDERTGVTLKLLKVNMDVSQKCIGNKDCANGYSCNIGYCIEQLSKSSTKPKRCPDGVCDSYELEYGVCPEDCPK
ncbi:MAG: carboxypeptidase regulatory-like domain-containing protein [Nanoarchaeota archaeon]